MSVFSVHYVTHSLALGTVIISYHKGCERAEQPVLTEHMKQHSYLLHLIDEKFRLVYSQVIEDVES